MFGFYSFCVLIISLSEALVFFPSGRGRESGLPSAGPGQDSVTVRHEETPENFAHVFRPTLRGADEGLWEAALLCSQGECCAIVFVEKNVGILMSVH